jgi:rod shape-determining protein MreC
MRNFIQFLVKYHIFLFFIGLQTLCFLLIIRNNSFHEASFANSSNKLVGTLFTWKNAVTQYIELQSVNDELARENEELRNKLNSSFISVNEHFVMINDTLRERKYRYKSAKIINSSVNKQLNFMTINKGRKDGLTPEMAVVNQQGLVGVVKDVSEHFSSVIPIVNLSFTASAELQRTGNFGLLRWDGKDHRYAVLNDVPGHVDIQPGDTIVTRGASGIYPASIPIGEVSEVEQRVGSNFHQIRIKLFNDFGKLRYVNVVENLLKEEQLILEEKATADGQ